MRIKKAFRTLSGMWTHTGIRQKFSTVFLLFIICPIITVSLLAGMFSRRDIEEQLKLLSNQLLRQIAHNLDGQLQSINRLALSITTNGRLLEDLGRYGQMLPLERVDAEYRLREWLTSFPESNPSVAGMYIFDEGGNVFFTNGTSPYLGYRAPEQPWYQKTVAARGAMVLFGTHDEFHVAKRPHRVISLCHAIRDFKSHATLGVLMIDLSQELFSDVFRQMWHGFYRDAELYVLDETGETVWAGGMDPTERLPRELGAAGAGGMNTCVRNGEEYFIFSYTSDFTGWRVLSLIPCSEVLSGADTTFALFAGMTAVFVGVFITCLLYILQKLIKPIRDMSRAAEMIKAGDFNVSLSFPGYGELSTLAESLMDMARDIQILIKDEYMSRILRRDAELKALQNQITPHFMLNSLECMRGMALEAKSANLAEMIKALATYTRYNITRSADFVTVREELNHIQDYMTVQNFRQIGKYAMELHIPDRCMDVRIMKLIFQPLLENAILHGLERKLGRGLIHISCREDGEDLLFQIRDNGLGMPEEEMRRLNRRLRAAGTDRCQACADSIGVENVNNRIRIGYGDRYGLHYEAPDGGGICVSVRIPNQTGGSKLAASSDRR